MGRGRRSISFIRRGGGKACPWAWGRAAEAGEGEDRGGTCGAGTASR